ncbi:MAG: DUF1961 family protein [Bacteroidota bacterium]
MILLVFSFTVGWRATSAQVYIPDDDLMLHENKLSAPSDVYGWVMEGKGVVEFEDEWMVMYSPGESGHHVYWAPYNLPSSFVASWEVQCLEKDAGLCIVFFAASGVNGEDIFDDAFPERDGKFKQYTNSKYFNNYHISYYANTKDFRSKEVTHLRKNAGFHKVQVGKSGIPTSSNEIHTVTLVKDHGIIRLLIDERTVIDWEDNGKKYGNVLGPGRLGFRQMKWTKFRYRNLKIRKIHS